MNGEELRHDRHQLIPTPQRRAVRVLVVNDSPDNVQSMALRLRRYGHEVEVALGGPAALRAAQAQQPDAVLLDISMPGMDGYQVARQLRAMFPGQAPAAGCDYGARVRGGPEALRRGR